MLRTFSWLAAAFAALCLTTASALGLGEIDVRSKLNQRLYAVIPLSSMTADEAEAAIIGLGSAEDFSRYGIERTDFLSSLRFAVSSEGGSPRIVVTSLQSAREPYLSFLVEVRTRTSRSLREYTVLLDPPDMPAPAAKPPPAKPAATPAPGEFYETPEEQQRRLAGMNKPATITPPAAKPAPVEAPAMPPPPPAEAPAVPAAPAMSAGPSTYGPVAQKETLWSIGVKLRPDASITMDQVLLALYKANPKSFEGFNGLRKGSVLNVPSAEDMRAVSASAAKKRVNELRGMGAPAPKAPAVPAEVPVIPVPPPPAASSPDLPPIPSTGAKPKPAVPALVPPPPPPAAATKPLPPPPPAAAKPLLPPPPPASATKPLVPPPALPKADTKPLLPPPPPPPAASATPQPATPAVSVPPPPPPPVAGTTTTPAPAPAAGVEEPLIPPAPPPAAVTLPKPIKPAPVIEEPVEEPSNAGLYLWVVVALIILGAGGFFGFKRWKEQQGGGSGGGEKKSFIPSAKLRKKAAEAGTSFEDAEPEAAAPQPARSAPAPAGQSFDQRIDSSMDSTGGQPSFTGNDFDATMTGESPAASFDSTSTMAMQTGQTQAYSSTQAIDSTQQRTAQNTAASVTQTSAAERLDFDVTSQFAAETMSINLDANDPVSEADFHLAYGLYDEAALLLKQAADKDPGRTDVRVKLAETYFAASRPNDFREVAAGLQMQLPEAEWQKLAIMGQQLLPDDPLFAGAGDAGLGSDIDLAFDEPATPSAPSAPAAAPAAQDAAADFGSLDFKLEELELPKLDEPKLDVPSLSSPAAAPAAPAPRQDSPLEFKLDAPAAHTPNFSSTAVGFNANSTSEVAAAKPQKLDFSIDDSLATVALNPDEGSADVRLDDFDLNEASTAISSGDEASTKLDLARAYADMGDNDMARTLLKEVVEQGNAAQQKEAQTLMGRLA